MHMDNRYANIANFIWGKPWLDGRLIKFYTLSGQIVFISLHKEALKLIKKNSITDLCLSPYWSLCKTSSAPIFQEPNCVSPFIDFTKNACYFQIPHQPTSTDFRIDYLCHHTQNGSELTMPWKCSLCLGTLMQTDYHFLVTKKESWARNWCSCWPILLEQGIDLSTSLNPEFYLNIVNSQENELFKRILIWGAHELMRSLIHVTAEPSPNSNTLALAITRTNAFVYCLDIRTIMA